MLCLRFGYVLLFLPLLFRSIFFCDDVCVLHLFTAILVQSNDWSWKKNFTQRTYCITFLLFRLLVNRYQCHLCREYMQIDRNMQILHAKLTKQIHRRWYEWEKETEGDKKRESLRCYTRFNTLYRNANKSKSSAFVYRNHKCCFVY